VKIDLWRLCGMNNIQIRKLVPNDLDCMYLLQEEYINKHVDDCILIKTSREAFARTFTNKNFGIGITDNERLIGFVTVGIPTSRGYNLGKLYCNFNDDKAEKVAHIKLIIVSEQFQRCHFASKLLSAAIIVLIYYEYIFTTVHPNNKASNALFLQNSFEKLKSINVSDQNERILYLLRRV
jgi:ribosomal protein S18 acetylase RimI-like enzyme